MTRTESEKRAAYHLTRKTATHLRIPGREIAFYAADHGTAHIGSFWAHAPQGLWLVVDGAFVLVGKLNKHERVLHAKDGQTCDYVERPIEETD